MCFGLIGVNHASKEATWMDLVERVLSIVNLDFQLDYQLTSSTYQYDINFGLDIYFIIIISIVIYYFRSRKLFWVDSLQDKLECSDFEGRKRSQIIMHIPHPFSVTMFESDIFWTDWYNKTVYSATKTGNNIEVFRHGLDGALDVRAVSRQRQPIDKSPCSDSNGRCTHLCLHRHTSYVCACPDITDSRECKSK